ncbi:hypothetical protein DTO271D3_7690 [Paecilomyces variotii]|nr:hypothetical protein DTO032I3_1778 [Paecilomyces variotii]KAJ9240302.1 hypothetical protein DTO169E5_4090 [Paecilomyces variotii]KAJ9281061.1 hypothetical protein DTO021D3_2115 [Paecilomyces variotii]KAJ9311987.1 hypothetical protein DTO271D3_7690 [Paecilomyces variotii]KAJ9345434.1 hypothetical protein DTO027B6_1965 [Paecilomyces variotii]
MAAPFSVMRPLSCLQSVSRKFVQPQICRRALTTIYSAKPEQTPIPEKLPQAFLSQLPARFRPDKNKKKLKVIAPPPSALKTCKDPISVIQQSQLDVLDPTGERKALFDYRRNPRSVKVGDILRVTFRSGDPFSGVCLNIRSRGIDTSFLLRNNLTRVGVEMWIKVFSPNVESVEIVQRTEKRKRRARLYYMRQAKHDMGTVENIVRNYLRQKSALTGQRTTGQRTGGRS